MLRGTNGGRAVAVLAANGRPIGNGRLLGYVPVNGTPFGNMDTPLIRLDTGRVVHGYECWWTPLDTTPAPQDAGEG